jgi:hypothetical protein
LILTTTDAIAIAKKLKAKIESTSAKHELAVLWVNGKRVGQFGIRRSSKEVGHD